MSESKLATFRIDKERWDKFVLLAKDNDSNASKLIIGFIDACIDNRIDLNIYTITPPKSTVSNIGIDEYLDSYLDTRIDSYLKKNLSSYLANCIDNSATEDSIETVLDPIIESVEMPVAIAGLTNGLLELIQLDIPTLDMVNTDVETYSPPQSIAADELRAIDEQSVVCDLEQPISFPKLAKKLRYKIPTGVVPSNPKKDGANDLLLFAKTLGYSYKWDGTGRNFYLMVD